MQNLVEKIVRSKIYDCQYWKEHCFGLTAELLIDKVMSLLAALVLMWLFLSDIRVRITRDV